MKYITQIILQIFVFSNILGQNDPQIQQIKDNKKVIETDSLDLLLNQFVDSNELLRYHSVSFPSDDKWRTGTIYTNKGDSITGKIKNTKQHGGMTSMFLYIRENEDSKKEKYRADKLLKYKLGNKEFHTKKFDNLPPGFIEILEEGELRLYFRKYRIVSGGYSPQSQTQYTSLDMVYEFYLELRKDASIDLKDPVPYSSKLFPDVISDFIKDYPALILKVKESKYNFTHLREIVQLYNLHHSSH